MENKRGNAYCFGDNIDTDVIIPARYLHTPDAAELAVHCFEDIDKDFIRNVKDDDIVVAGWNFGCGSSREHAPLAIKANNVGGVIAKSFARIFYRNAINIGLPILECEEAVNAIEHGDDIEIDFNTGTITNLTKNEKYQAVPFPPFIQDLIDAGGLMAWTKIQQEKENA